jgi:hypothetical protein
MPKQDNEKVKRERKIKSTINLEKLTKIQKHDIFKGHTNKNQEIDKKKKTYHQCMRALDSCQGLPSQPERRAKYLPAAQCINKKKILQKDNTHQINNYVNQSQFLTVSDFFNAAINFLKSTNF